MKSYIGRIVPDLWRNINKKTPKITGHPDRISERLIMNMFVNFVQVGNRHTDDRSTHSAVRAGHEDIIELLIAKGANVNAKNAQGQTPLDIAVNRGHAEIAELLRKYGPK